jgi:hypothetical protein
MKLERQMNTSYLLLEAKGPERQKGKEMPSFKSLFSQSFPPCTASTKDLGSLDYGGSC